MYDRKPQTAIAGIKYTIVTNENKLIHRKRMSKPFKVSFQNPEAQAEDLRPLTKSPPLGISNGAAPQY